MSAEITYGSRVKVTPTVIDEWAVDALKALTGIEGTVIEVKEDLFDHSIPVYQVEFAKPVRRWWGSSTSELSKFYTHFHFHGRDLTVIAEQA